MGFSCSSSCSSNKTQPSWPPEASRCTLYCVVVHSSVCIISNIIFTFNSSMSTRFFLLCSKWRLFLLQRHIQWRDSFGKPRKEASINIAKTLKWSHLFHGHWIAKCCNCFHRFACYLQLARDSNKSKKIDRDAKKMTHFQFQGDTCIT